MKRLSQLLLLAALCFTPVFAQDADPLAPIKSAVKDGSKPFTLIVEFKVKPESMKEMRKLIQEAVKNTKLEPGNAAYQVHADAASPNTLVFFEIWRSMEALESHVKQEYTKNLLGKAGELCESAPAIRVLTPFIPGAPGKPKAAAAPAPASASPNTPVPAAGK